MPATTATRLSALDAAFLQGEATAPMHVGGVLVFEGPAPGYDEVAALVEERLEALPRWRERLAYPAGGLLRPCWVHDESFDLGLHLRHTALPRPRTEAQLRALAGRILSARLDLRRPLWQLYLVDGLEGERFAIVAKLHHALAGVEGTGVVAALLEAGPATEGAVTPPDRARFTRAGRTVPPAPSEAQVLAASALGQARDVAGFARGALATLRHRPSAAALAVARTARDATDRVEARLDRARPCLYDGPAGAARALAWARASVPAVQRAADAAGVTQDDVVLAALAGALRAHCERRGQEPVALRALVRTGDGREGAATLPVDVADPPERLERVRATTLALPDAGQGRRMPPRAVNLAVTSFPGPPEPLHLLGRRLREVFPAMPLPREHALSVAVLRCEDRIGVGLLGCASALADVDDLAVDVSRAFAELTDPQYPRHVRRVVATGGRRSAPDSGVMNFDLNSGVR